MNTQMIEKAIEIVGNQAALAKACSVSQPAVSKWLQGAEPKFKHALLIEKATLGQVTVAQIFAEPVDEAAA